MNIGDFNQTLTSKQLVENLQKQFGLTVSLNKYNREQLEDVRNKVRTRIFQQEGMAGINDLLSDEAYQKDKAMLELLNTRIKEMLGEDIKKLRDKMDQLSEAKKGDGNLANNAKPYDKVTRGDVIAGRLGKDEQGGKKVKETRKRGPDTYGKADASDKPLAVTGSFPTSLHPGHDERSAKFSARQAKGTMVKGKAQSAAQPKDDTDLDEAAKECNHSAKGTSCPVHGMKECGMYESDSPVSDKAKSGKKWIQKAVNPEEKGELRKKLHAKPGEPIPAAKLAKAAKAKGELGQQARFAKTVRGFKESTAVFRSNVRLVNESLGYLLNEDEEEKAKAITAAGDMVNDFTSWMQRVGQYQTKSMIELADNIRHNFGAAESEQFKQTVGPALSAALEVLTAQREAISNAVATLAGEAVPEVPMGQEPGISPTVPDEMNASPEEMPDEFGASDAAAGGSETTGREMRESSFSRKLRESHSIMSKLAK